MGGGQTPCTLPLDLPLKWLRWAYFAHSGFPAKYRDEKVLFAMNDLFVDQIIN